MLANWSLSSSAPKWSLYKKITIDLPCTLLLDHGDGLFVATCCWVSKMAGLILVKESLSGLIPNFTLANHWQAAWCHIFCSTQLSWNSGPVDIEKALLNLFVRVNWFVHERFVSTIYVLICVYILLVNEAEWLLSLLFWLADFTSPSLYQYIIFTHLWC